MIDKKIKNLELEINKIKKDLENLQNKDCHGGIHECEYSRLFLEFARSLDASVKPLDGLVLSVIEDDEIILERIQHVMPLLVMTMTNVQNRILLTLQELVSKINSGGEEQVADFLDLKNQLDKIHRIYNRIKIITEHHELFHK